MAGININGEQLQNGAGNINTARKKIREGIQGINENFVNNSNVSMKNEDIDQLIEILAALSTKSKLIEEKFYEVFNMPKAYEPTNKNDFLRYFDDTKKQNDWIQFLAILSDKQFIKDITTQSEERYNSYTARIVTNTKQTSKITKKNDFYTDADSIDISLKRADDEKARSTYLQIVSRATDKEFLLKDKSFTDSITDFFQGIINNQLSMMDNINDKHKKALKTIGDIENSSQKFMLNKNFIEQIKNNIVEQQKNVIPSMAKAEGIELQDSTLIYELKDDLENPVFKVTLKKASILEVNFITKIKDPNSIATVSDIRAIRSRNNETKEQIIKELVTTIIKVILDNLGRFYKGDDINRFYSNTIKNEKFQNELLEVVKIDYQNKQKNIEAYIKSMFGSEPGEAPEDKNSKAYEKYEQGLTGRRSLIQGSIGELVETALINLKSKEAEGYTIDAQVIGQMSNLLDQEGHGDIQVKIKNKDSEQVEAIVNIQAKQYNSTTMGQSVYFYKENSYDIFSKSFIRYVGKRPEKIDPKNVKQNFVEQIFNNDTIKFLREYSLIAQESGDDVSAKLFPYFSRFSRIEDICEKLDLNVKELSMNNFISFNFGLVPMSYILDNIILDLENEKNITQKSQLFTIYPMDINDKDKFSDVKNIYAEYKNLLNVSYQTKNDTQSKNMVSLLKFSGLHVSINNWIQRDKK